MRRRYIALTWLSTTHAEKVGHALKSRQTVKTGAWNSRLIFSDSIPTPKVSPPQHPSRLDATGLFPCW